LEGGARYRATSVFSIEATFCTSPPREAMAAIVKT